MTDYTVKEEDNPLKRDTVGQLASQLTAAFGRIMTMASRLVATTYYVPN